MGLLIARRGRFLARRLPLLLLPAFLLAAFAASVPAQSRLSLSLAEVREIQTIRELRQSGEGEALVQAAQGYLERFPQGRYRDETLMALAEAHAGLKAPKEALDAYEQVIAAQPESPFREEALAASLPLLQELGEAERAQARSAELLQSYPRSLYRGRTVLWQAQQAYDREAYGEAVKLLDGIDPDEGLRGADKAAYFRLAGWARHKQGDPAKASPYFARYLELEDSAAHKAPVLMLMAEAYAASGRRAEALDFYGQVAERYPEPDYLPEAQFRRAELFVTERVEPAPEGERAAALAQAVALYDAYLAGDDTAHLEAALRARGGLLVSSGRKEEALRDYERLAALTAGNRPDPENLVIRAGLLADLERGDEGIALLTRAIGNNSLSRQARSTLVVERAALHYRLKDCPGVLASLKPLPVFANPAHRRRAFFLRGFCRYQLGEWEQASWDLEGLVNEAEYVETVWPALAEAYERSGQYSRLVNTGERLLEDKRIAPSEELFLRLGKGYEELGQPAMMLSAFQRLGEVNPEALETPEVQLRMGRAEEALGHADRAETHYLAVLAAWPEDAPAPPEGYMGALERLQGVYLNQGRHEPLIELNRKARARVPEEAQKARIAGWQATAYLRWGEAEASAGNAVAAGEHFAAAWGALPEKPGQARFDVLQALARHHARNNAHEQAVALYTAELKRPAGAPYKQQVAAAFGAFYLDWARSSEGRAEPARVIERYEQALRLLPEAEWRPRYEAALRLEALYGEQGNFKRRAEMFDGLAATVPDEALRDKLRIYRSRIYGDWSRHEAARGNIAAARALNAKGAALLHKDEWRQRYELMAGRGEILLKEKNYADLVIAYERFLPEIQDAALQAQVRHFLGQVYLTWAQQAKAEHNDKSTRIRAYYALDNLPASDWERRLAATRLLAGLLEAQKKPAEALALYAEVVPQLPPGKTRQQYALFLGRRYADDPKAGEEARKWLALADAGSNDPLSVEAAYTLAELDYGQKKADAALERLENLKARGLEQTKWQVPVYSRLAVIYHERNDLPRALAHYRVVANVKSPEQRKLYPRSVALARQQVRAIEEYQRFSGGKAGGKIAIPKVRR